MFRGVIGFDGPAGEAARGLVIAPFPAPPNTGERWIRGGENVGRHRDPGVGSCVFLQFAYGDLQGESGIGSGFRLGLGLGAGAWRNGRKAQQADCHHSEQNQQREGDDQRAGIRGWSGFSWIAVSLHGNGGTACFVMTIRANSRGCLARLLLFFCA